MHGVSFLKCMAELMLKLLIALKLVARDSVLSQRSPNAATAEHLVEGARLLFHETRLLNSWLIMLSVLLVYSRSDLQVIFREQRLIFVGSRRDVCHIDIFTNCPIVRIIAISPDKLVRTDFFGTSL